jgi:hypothetical protein
MQDSLAAPNQFMLEGVKYEMNEWAETQLRNINFCDQRIQQLQSEWAVADTARMAYSAALKREFSSQKA